MKVISCYTPNLSDKAEALELSLKENDFDYRLINHAPEDIPTFDREWPKNRGFYCTAQGGEFLQWVDDDLICLIDVDTIAQRKWTEEELKEITPERGEFIACFSSYPPMKLTDQISFFSSKAIAVKQSYLEFSAACLIAHRDDWARLNEYYVPMFAMMKQKIAHHALTQWIINLVIQSKLKLRIGPEWLHNAEWYIGTKARNEDGILKIEDKPIIFNHTK